MRKQTIETGGILEPGRLLTKRAAMRCLGMGDWAWRELLKHGLPTVKQGRCVYVFSDDLLSVFLLLRDKQCEQPKNLPAPSERP